MPALFLIHVCPSQFPNFWLKEKNKTERDSRRPRSRHSGSPPRDGGRGGSISQATGSRLGQEAQEDREPTLEEAIPGYPRAWCGGSNGQFPRSMQPNPRNREQAGLCREHLDSQVLWLHTG